RRVPPQGRRVGHGRGERGPRVPRGLAGLRVRGRNAPDPRGPERAADDKQPAEDLRTAAPRDRRHEADPARGEAEPREPAVPEDEAGEVRAPARLTTEGVRSPTRVS